MSKLTFFSAVIFFYSVPFTFSFQINTLLTNKYYNLPRFWTNTGFCPFGKINNEDISSSLLSSDVRTNLELIGALPNGGISTVRIHWLLELIDLTKIVNQRIPEYDFNKLDKLVDWVDEAGLALGFEMMGNPGGIFNFKNVSKDYLWEDLSFQIAQRYLERLGVDKLLKWRFESWNEPDLKAYNLLNFGISEYLTYLQAIKRGLLAASRERKNLYLPLRGPAGLFKNPSRHPLCWSALQVCNNTHQCPFDVLTFHRKGQGYADEVATGGQALISSILKQFSGLKHFKFSNDEADPIAGWSVPRQFQSNVQYAVIVVLIVLKHWTAILNSGEFKNLESISHDNAFLSYYPHVFDQRTLLARFQINNTNPPHTQFIQKPVYAALGLLGNLGEFAKDVEYVNEENLTILTTSASLNEPMYIASVIVKAAENERNDYVISIPLEQGHLEGYTFAYIVDVIETGTTDPVEAWKYYGSPAYPNATVRKVMRSMQTPKILASKLLKTYHKAINIPITLRSPWIMLIRVCSSDVVPPFKPNNLRIRKVNSKEILLIWKEIFRRERCLKTYEVYFKKNSEGNWKLISQDVYVPFTSFHFQPEDGVVTGMYKVRGVDIFGRPGEYSKAKKN